MFDTEMNSEGQGSIGNGERRACETRRVKVWECISFAATLGASCGKGRQPGPQNSQQQHHGPSDNAKEGW